MSHIREIADTPEKGKIRNNLYTAVISRYKQAMDASYYLEAITLMESLITDRLESALNYYECPSQPSSYPTFKYSLDQLHKEGIISDGLYSDLDNWRASRNMALHNMAKIEKGDAPVFAARYSTISSIAQMGYTLFRKLETEIR